MNPQRLGNDEIAKLVLRSDEKLSKEERTRIIILERNLKDTGVWYRMDTPWNEFLYQRNESFNHANKSNWNAIKE